MQSEAYTADFNFAGSVVSNRLDCMGRSPILSPCKSVHQEGQNYTNIRKCLNFTTEADTDARWSGPLEESLKRYLHSKKLSSQESPVTGVVLSWNPLVITDDFRHCLIVKGTSLPSQCLKYDLGQANYHLTMLKWGFCIEQDQKENIYSAKKAKRGPRTLNKTSSKSVIQDEETVCFQQVPYFGMPRKTTLSGISSPKRSVMKSKPLFMPSFVAANPSFLEQSSQVVFCKCSTFHLQKVGSEGLEIDTKLKNLLDVYNEDILFKTNVLLKKRRGERIREAIQKEREQELLTQKAKKKSHKAPNKVLVEKQNIMSSHLDQKQPSEMDSKSSDICEISAMVSDASSKRLEPLNNQKAKELTQRLGETRKSLNTKSTTIGQICTPHENKPDSQKKKLEKLQQSIERNKQKVSRHRSRSIEKHNRLSEHSNSRKSIKSKDRERSRSIENRSARANLEGAQENGIFKQKSPQNKMFPFPSHLEVIELDSDISEFCDTVIQP